MFRNSKKIFVNLYPRILCTQCMTHVVASKLSTNHHSFLEHSNCACTYKDVLHIFLSISFKVQNFANLLHFLSRTIQWKYNGVCQHISNSQTVVTMIPAWESFGSYISTGWSQKVIRQRLSLWRVPIKYRSPFCNI